MRKRMDKGDEPKGIEVGSFQTSGADGDLEQDEMKARLGASAGRGSAEPAKVSNVPDHHLAHSRPVCD